MDQPMPMPPQGGAAPQEESAPPQGGGASQLVADTHSNMLKLLDLVQAKLPEDGQALSGIIQSFQGWADGLGQAPGAEKQGPAMPATTSPEAGAASVKPAM